MPTVSGEYFLPPVYEATPGDRIRADQHNIPLRDVAQGLTDRVMRDGTSPMTGNLPMNGNQIKGLAAGVANSDAARMDQVRGASWQMTPLTTTDDLNATITPGVYAWDGPTSPQNVPVAASAATLLVTQGVNSNAVQQEWIERDGTRRMWRVRNGASAWLPWAEAVAGVDAEAMRAQVGITVGSDGLTRLNESVNHIDSSWEAGVSDVPGIPSPNQARLAGAGMAVSIAEGAVGAPRVMPKALSSGFVGALSGSGQTPYGFSDIEYAKSIRLVATFFRQAGSQGCVQISFSSNGGSAWGGWQDLSIKTTSTTPVIFSDSHIDLETGAMSTITAGFDIQGLTQVNLTLPAGIVDSIRFRGSTPNPSSVSLYVTGGRSGS